MCIECEDSGFGEDCSDQEIPLYLTNGSSFVSSENINLYIQNQYDGWE